MEKGKLMNISVQKVHDIIGLSEDHQREYRERGYGPVVTSGQSMYLRDPLVRTTEERLLDEYLDSLSELEMKDVLGLLSIGRGDIPASDFDLDVESAYVNSTTRAYVSSKLPLSRYLNDGLKALGMPHRDDLYQPEGIEADNDGADETDSTDT